MTWDWYVHAYLDRLAFTIPSRNLPGSGWTGEKKLILRCKARERRQWNPDEVLGVANADVPSRETALVWKWCAEDRYFLRQYWDATKFGEAALRCRDLHETEMQELEQLRERCGKKLGLDSTSSKERIQNES